MMFFPELVRNIEEGDQVLEVGPGGNPHPKADILLEKKYSSHEEYVAQCGVEPVESFKKKTIFYDGHRFPFEKYDFQYVICSHVLEHVDNPEEFCKELMRVASKGYIEIPTIFYEILYNFEVHKNLIFIKNGKVFILPKSATNFNDWLFFQKQLRKTLVLQEDSMLKRFKGLFFQGMEWDDSFEFQVLSTIEEFQREVGDVNVENLEWSKDEKENHEKPSFIKALAKKVYRRLLV